MGDEEEWSIAISTGSIEKWSLRVQLLVAAGGKRLQSISSYISVSDPLMVDLRFDSKIKARSILRHVMADRILDIRHVTEVWMLSVEPSDADSR